MLDIDYKNLTEKQIEEFVEEIDWDKVPKDFLISETAFRFIEDFEILKDKVYSYIIEPENYSDEKFIKRISEGIDKGYLINWNNSIVFSMCCWFDQIDLVRKFIKNGVDITNNRTCLSFAASEASVEMVKILLENGADPYITNPDVSYNPFICAVKSGSVEKVKLFIEAGIDVNYMDSYGMILASSNGYLDIVRYMLDCGANIHAQSDLALFWARQNQKWDVVMLLAEYETLYKK